MRTSDLDNWLPDPQVRSRHRRESRAEADELWSSAQAVRLDQTRTLGRLVRWRIPGTPQDTSFRDLLARYPFTVLDEGDDWSISGLCGRIWTFQRDYPRLEGAEAWRAWDEPGTVRVLFGTWIEPGRDGSTALVSEARVRATDRMGSIRLRGIWLAVGRFERLIGAEPLRLAVAGAERGSVKAD